LPPHLARRGTPDLEGEVVDVREVQNLVRDGCLVGTLRAIAGAGRALREHQTVFLVRVRRADGAEEQSRIEKDVVAAMPSLGDYVSLWGRRRYGVLVIRRGYNHSVSGEIRVR
jgi:hypothetical protein